MWKRMPNNVSPDRIRSLIHCIYSVLYVQVNKCRTFSCDFFEVPLITYSSQAFPKKPFEIDDSNVVLRKGTIQVNFLKALMRQGSFKTAHPGAIQFQGGTNQGTNPFTDPDGLVCVKQVYELNDDGTTILRLKGRHELQKLSTECNCLIWASILLDLTYQFVNREVMKKGQPSHRIPVLRFARSMIAVVRENSMEKVFLVEEWLNQGDHSGHKFLKYVGNHFPQSCLDPTDPPEAHNVAEFLIFAQHVQWVKTGGRAFTSDYQGAGDVLTDPQITSNPCVLPVFRFKAIVLIPKQDSWQSIWGWQPVSCVQQLSHKPHVQSLLQIFRTITLSLNKRTALAWSIKVQSCVPAAHYTQLIDSHRPFHF